MNLHRSCSSCLLLWGCCVAARRLAGGQIADDGENAMLNSDPLVWPINYAVPEADMLQHINPAPAVSCDGEAVIRKEVERVIFDELAMPLPTDRMHARSDPAQQGDWGLFELPGREPWVYTKGYGMRIKTLATAIRGIFHDAQDFMSLKARQTPTSLLVGFGPVFDGKEYCADAPVVQYMSAGIADCEERCANEAKCKYVSLWTTNWCKLTEACDRRATDPHYQIDITKKVEGFEQFRSWSTDHCADTMVWQGESSSEALCAARCIAEPTCGFFMLDNNQLCILTTTCDRMQPTEAEGRKFVTYRKLADRSLADVQSPFRQVTVDRDSYVDIETSGSYGGVDGCLYNPNTCWDGAKCSVKSWIPREQELNRVIQKVVLDQDDEHLVARSRFFFALEACRNLCCKGSSPMSLQDRVTLCGKEFSICKEKYHNHRHWEDTEDRMFDEEDLLKDKCLVDMTALGTLVITSRVGGPDIQMFWGRRQGNCKNLLDGLEVQSGVNASSLALHGSSMAFAEMGTVMDHFKRMGFSEEEAAALMGAHSFAKQHKYAGMWAPRKGGQGFCDTLRGGGYDTFVGWNDTWGDGNFWDRTPDQLDNDYYKLFIDGDGLGDESNCCGSETQFGCSTRWEEGDNPDKRQGCQHQWCMRSPTPWMPRNAAEKDWAMLSTQMSLDQWNRSKFPESEPPPIRLVRLAADQVLMHTAKTKEAVRVFARNESAFHEAYALAFSKMIRLGYKQGELQACDRAPAVDFQLHDGVSRRYCGDPEAWSGPVASSANCEARCVDEPSCGYYSFWNTKKLCRLTTTCCSRLEGDHDITIQKKVGHPGLAVWDAYKGPGRFACQEIHGDVLASISGSSCQADCQQRCALDVDCNFATYWSYSFGGTHCSLTKSCTLVGYHAVTVTVYKKP